LSAVGQSVVSFLVSRVFRMFTRPFRVVELHMLDDNIVYCSLRDSHSVTAEPTAHSVVYKFLLRDYVQSLLWPIVTQLLGYRENASCLINTFLARGI